MTVTHAGVLAVVLAAAFIQGASGFGFGITATAILPLFVDAKVSVVYVAVITPLVCGRLWWELRREGALGEVLPILAGSTLVGLTLGTAIYAVSDTWLLNQIIGLGLAAGCGAMWAGGVLRQRRLPRWVGFPVGVLSGAMGGICNVGGPPVVIYLWMQPLSKRAANARLQAVFTIASGVRLAGLLAAPALVGRRGFEAVSLSAVLVALSAVPALTLGTWLGLKVFHRIDHRLLRRSAYLFAIVMGLVLFARTRWGTERPGRANTRPASAARSAEASAPTGGLRHVFREAVR